MELENITTWSQLEDYLLERQNFKGKDTQSYTKELRWKGLLLECNIHRGKDMPTYKRIAVLRYAGRCGFEEVDTKQLIIGDVIKWVAVKDNPPPKGGIFIIYDNGIGEGLYHKLTGEWKSTDRPIKNATGAKVLRQTIKPLYWLDLKPPCL